MNGLQHRRTARALGTAIAATSLGLATFAGAATRPWVEYDLRVHGSGAKTVDVTHAGQSVIIDLFATMHGIDADTGNDAIGLGGGTFVSSTGGLLGDLLGLGPPAPYNASASNVGVPADADADGDLDIWSAADVEAGKYIFRLPPPYPLPQPAGGALVGQVQFTVDDFTLEQTDITWAQRTGTFTLVGTADGTAVNRSKVDILYGAPVTIRGVTQTPPPGVTYLSGNIAAHASIAQETWVTPGLSLTFDTGVDITAAGTLNANGRPLQVNVNDATSGNFGGAIVGGNIAVGTTANGTFTQGGGSTQVGNVTAGAAATRTGTLDVTGGQFQASAVSLGAAGGGIGAYTQSGGAANFLQLNLANDSTATVSAGQLTVSGITSIGGNGSSGTFTQAGGTTTFNGDANVGVNGGAGRLVVSGGTLVTGRTTLGADGGAGTLEVSGTGVFKPAVLMVNRTAAPATGTISGGQIETTGIHFFGAGVITQTGGAVATTVNGNLLMNHLVPGASQYVLAGGSLSVSSMQIGKTNAAPLPGTGKAGGFVQSGGVANLKSLIIDSAGTVNAAGGTMNIGARLDVRGTLDYGGSSAQLNVGTNAFASFVLGDIVAANNATFSGADGSLMSFASQAQYNSVGTVTSAGLVHIAGQPLVIEEDQSIGGSGTIEGNVTNEGTIAPGSSPGALTINGSYTQAATGALLMEIAGVDAELFDTLTATGTAALDGELNVALLDGFVPSAADSFHVIGASSLSGAFDNVIGGELSFAGGMFDVTYSPSGVTLSNFSAVPEPAGIATLGVAIAAAKMSRRRRA
jgi:hypothetical protein